MSKIPGGLDLVIVYLDGILIFSNTAEGHLDHLYVVFTRLKEYNMTLNDKNVPHRLQKCVVVGRYTKCRQHQAVAEEHSSHYAADCTEEQTTATSLSGDDQLLQGNGHWKVGDAQVVDTDDINEGHIPMDIGRERRIRGD